MKSVWVDGSKAREWLRTSDLGKPVQLDVVMQFLHLMEVEAQFDRRLSWEDGRLSDGRHRLLAVILHGRAVRMEG